MTTTKDLRVFIGATDFGPLGADMVQRVSCGRGGPDRIALADLQLIKEGGGGYAILNRHQVKAYEWTSTNHNPSVGYISAVFFGGFINLPSTGRAPGSTLKTWKLSVQDYNIQKLRLVVPAAHALGRINAGTFANQIEQLFVKLQTGASLAFDYVSRVLNLTGATILPVIYVNGKNLAHAMEAIFASARAVDPNLRPVFRLRPDPTVGSAITFWQTPLVDVWDSAAPPSSILTLDEDTTTDILARDGYTRVLDSTDQVTKRQSMRKDTGRVSTYTATAAVAIWPNPCDPNGAWWAEPFDTDVTSNAEQDAELLADVEGTANPRETLSLSTQRTPPPDGAEYLDVTLALEGLSAELYGVAGGSTDFVRRLAPATDSPYLLTTRLDLGLPRVLLGQPGGGSQRPPVISVPPDVPSALAATSVYNEDTGQAENTYTWTLPANLAGIIGYAVYETTDGLTYRHYVAGVSATQLTTYVNPSSIFTGVVRSVGSNGLESVESAPYGPFTSAAPPRIRNGSFELPDPADVTLPRWWTRSNQGTGTSSRNAQHVTAGTWALKLIGSVGGGGGRGGMTSNRFSAPPATRLALEFNAMEDTAGVDVTVTFTFYDSSGALISAYGGPVFLTTDFVHYVFYADTPAATERVEVDFLTALTSAGGSVWIDQVIVAPAPRRTQSVGSGDSMQQVQTGTTWPGSPSAGDLFFRSDLGTLLYWDGAAWQSTAPAQTRTVQFVISGGGSAIPAGDVLEVPCDFAFTITGVTLLADVTGSVVIDILRTTYSSYDSGFTSLCASAKPTISSAKKSQDTTLTGWTTAISAGDVLRLHVDSASTVTRVTLALQITIP